MGNIYFDCYLEGMVVSPIMSHTQEGIAVIPVNGEM